MRCVFLLLAVCLLCTAANGQLENLKKVIEDVKEQQNEQQKPQEGNQPQFIDVDYEYCVLGAGPGGLQAAVYLQEANVQYVVIDKEPFVGSFFSKYPRHRRLLSHNRRFTGQDHPEFALRHDWNSLLSPKDGSPLMSDFSDNFLPEADEMVSYLKFFAKFHKLNLKMNTEITKVSRMSKKPLAGFVLTDKEGGSMNCGYVIVATARSVPNIPAVDGIEHAEGYEAFSTDRKKYENKRILILGLGNAAFETAQHLLPVASHVHVLGRAPELRLSAFTHYIGDLRAPNLQIMDNFLLKTQDHIDLGVELTYSQLVKDQASGLIRWIPDPKKPIDNYHYRRPYHHVIRCLGWRFDDSIFEPDVQPALSSPAHGRYPAVTSNFESTNVSGMYFAGTLLHGIDWRKSTGGVIHGFRYLTRYAVRRMLQANNGKAFPSSAVVVSPDRIAEALFQRLITSSGLLSLFGTLCDVVAWEDGAGNGLYQEEVLCKSFAEVSSMEKAKRMNWITIEVRWADTNKNDWNKVVINYPGQAHWTRVLHPIIRYFRFLPDSNGQYAVRQVAEYHTMEDGDQTFNYRPIWFDPMRDFIARMFEGDFRSQEEILRARQQELYEQFAAQKDLPKTKINIWDPFFGRFSFFPAGVEETPQTRTQILDPIGKSEAPGVVPKPIVNAASKVTQKTPEQPKQKAFEAVQMEKLMPMHGENDGVSPDKPFNWDLEARKPTEVRDGSGVEVSEGMAFYFDDSESMMDFLQTGKNPSKISFEG